MGKQKVDKSQYEPGPGETMSAAIAADQARKFAQNYQPLLIEARDRNIDKELLSHTRMRGNADAMQALTAPENLSMGLVADPEVNSAVSMGLSAQLGEADYARKGAHNDQQLGTMQAANGLSSTAQSGLAAAARLESAERLNQARRTQSERASRHSMAGNIAGAFLGQGIANMRSGPDAGFFSPMKKTGVDMSTGEYKYEKMGLGDRLKWGLGAGYGKS